MIRVALITTGRCEQSGLARSLRRCFQDAEFLDPVYHDGFTSIRLNPTLPPRTIGRTSAERLAAGLVATLLQPKQRRRAADFAIVVDDLELVNADQPKTVVDHFVDGVRAHVERFSPHQSERQRIFDQLRARGSFHLIKPMIEAYFFGEPAALTRAGVASDRAVRRTTTDLEEFETDDPDYLSQEISPFAAKHPKLYVRHLLGRRYVETADGVRALECLDWQSCTSTTNETRFAHSLFQDLASMLDAPNPCPGECHPTTLAKNPGVLRNI